MNIKKNFIYNVLYQLLILIIPLITTPYIARVVGADGVGVQSYTYSIVNYFVLFAMLGVNNYGNRSIAALRDNENELNRTFWSIYSLQAVLSIIMLCSYLLYVILFVNENKIISYIQIIYIFSALLDINWLFWGMENFKVTVTRNAIIKIISAFSIFIFVKNKNDLYMYSLILALGAMLSQIILWVFAKQYVHFVKIRLKDVLKHFKPAFILFVPVIAVSLYKVMDKIMIGCLSNMMQVGFYENSEKIINIPISFIAALGTVMLPRMSNLQAKGLEKESKGYISLSMEFVIFIAVGSALGLAGIAPVFVPIFLGQEFIDCIDIVLLLSVTIVFIAWANVIRTQYLIPKKMDKIFIISTLLGAVINFFINACLIGRYGARGAAIGTIFAEFTVAFYQTLKVKNDLDIKGYMKKGVFYFIPGIAMYLLITMINYYFNTISIGVGIVEIIVGGLVYLLISLIYMIKTKNKIVFDLMRHIQIKYRNSKVPFIDK
ncbi:flippase [uncultured Clostridium sp.]|uniref:flippase n=1 Tax=uncultured Clostridium sp. TaxID=59620 RepID=UPI0025D81D90|nr:flippase [uncultured Clostridium sp.]